MASYTAALLTSMSNLQGTGMEEQGALLLLEFCDCCTHADELGACVVEPVVKKWIVSIFPVLCL